MTGIYDFSAMKMDSKAIKWDLTKFLVGLRRQRAWGLCTRRNPERLTEPIEATLKV